MTESIKPDAQLVTKAQLIMPHDFQVQALTASLTPEGAGKITIEPRFPQTARSALLAYITTHVDGQTMSYELHMTRGGKPVLVDHARRARERNKDKTEDKEQE